MELVLYHGLPGVCTCVVSFKGSRWRQTLSSRFHSKLIQIRCLCAATDAHFIPRNDRNHSHLMSDYRSSSVSVLSFPSGFFEMKMKYDESDNAVIRASRVVTDRVTDFLGTVMLHHKI